jgi:UDP-glucuronate 4-epimerase
VADDPVVVTGAAGFVGMHVAERLLDRGERVVGLDEFNAYYDPALKEARAARLRGRAGFEMVRGDIAEPGLVEAVLRRTGSRRVVHLAAQAGVRYSLENPFAYQRSNLAGHLAVLEACRNAGCEHLVYASSSSVYGDRALEARGFRETDPTDAPVSLYAATKKSCEVMSAAYASLYGLPQSGLRFFTVYGPWGRPDMAYFSFTRRILAGEPIELYGDGRSARDYTFVDDIVTGVIGVLDRPPASGHEIYNIGGDRPEPLDRLVAVLEAAIGRPAVLKHLPKQPGDVSATWADVTKIAKHTGYVPSTRLEEGLARFVGWLRRYIAR